MGKTFRQEPRHSKKGESDAHKLRRAYKEVIDHVLDLDEEELEDMDFDDSVNRRRDEVHTWTMNQ
jgi:hypothetical protein